MTERIERERDDDETRGNIEMNMNIGIELVCGCRIDTGRDVAHVCVREATCP